MPEKRKTSKKRKTVCCALEPEPEVQPTPAIIPDPETPPPPQDVQPTSPPQDTQPETDDDAPKAGPSKKKYHQSKKEIPDYDWTREANQRLGEFVQDHAELYDKRSRERLNVEAKNSLWTLAGGDLDPTATGAQTKKQYENQRTRVGKLLRKESKSGSGQPDRSERDNDLFEARGFLQSHISRGPTHTTEEFSQASQSLERVTRK